ncbi:MAG: hypothetical protein WC110_06690 [Bacteroidales bacterium]|jgi:hypothetical protein|nr:hypothetical protein [Bacteroidales bacterium]
MKKINHILSLTGVCLFLFSACSEAPLVKSEVEAGFDVNSANIPTITIGSTSNLTAKSVTVSAAVSNIADPASIIDLGFMYSTENAFASDAAVKTVQCTYASNISATLTLNPNTTYYIKAVAATADGSAASETITISTPDLPLYDKLDGAVFVKSNVADYWGDVYNFSITLKAIGNNQFNICDLDPYFYKNGYTFAKGVNYAVGTFDPATKTITVEAGQSVGYKDCVFVGYNGDIIDFTITFNEAATTMTFNEYLGVYSSAGWYCLYLPMTLNRK